ncbi:MAG: DnaD domain protein [Clostridia bacterium]|nr:DnaD domain protein [Clostridia bacterium]
MSLCKFQPDSAGFGTTVVQTRFIRQYMPHAPGDYVKVYLYGLSLCCDAQNDEDLTGIAQALDLAEDQVRNAFFYWQQQGLVRIQNISGAPEVFYCAAAADMQNALVPGDRFREINSRINALFAPRQITPRELDAMHEWMDALGFSMQSVILLLEYCIRMHGKEVALAYMDAVAHNWAQEGLTQPGDIQMHLQERSAQVRDVNAILASLGIRKRSATDPELELYRKWTQEWGFDYAAIELACRQSAGAQTPTMKYVDTILSSFVENNVFTAEEIQSFLQVREQRRRNALTIQNILGVKGAASPTLMQCMDDWRVKYGYDMPVFTIAAQQAARKNQKTLDSIETHLRAWHEAGLLSVEDIHTHLTQKLRVNDDAAHVLHHLGLEYAPNEAMRQTFDIWTRQWQLPLDVIVFGADSIVQSGVQYDRVRALHNLLQSWQEHGVQTVEHAKGLARMMHTQQIPRMQAPQQQNPALNYSQRDNSLEDLYMDL